MTWRYVVCRAAPLLLIILLVSYFSGDGWRAFPSALVAWGTILLAFATFSLVRHSKEQEDHRRQEEQAKERRDRKERLLNEIIEWAEDVASSAFHRKGKNDEEFWRVLLDYRNLQAKMGYIAIIAKSNFSEISEALLDTSEKLNELEKYTKGCTDHTADASSLWKHEKILEQSVERLLKEAAEIKVKLIS